MFDDVHSLYVSLILLQVNTFDFVYCTITEPSDWLSSFDRATFIICELMSK